MFIAALFTTGKMWRQPKFVFVVVLSSYRWVNKENAIYIYNGVLFVHQKEGTPTICDDMNGP